MKIKPIYWYLNHKGAERLDKDYILSLYPTKVNHSEWEMFQPINTIERVHSRKDFDEQYLLWAAKNSRS